MSDWAGSRLGSAGSGGDPLDDDVPPTIAELQRAARRPILIVPGTFGTELNDAKGRRVWPPRGWGWLSAWRILGAGLVPGAVRARVPSSPLGGDLDQWDRLRWRLGEAYRAPDMLHPIGYDWRLPPREAGKRVAEEIRAVCQRVPGPRPVLVAFSLGTVVARVALDLCGASDLVHRVVLVGSVDRGYPGALRALSGGRVFPEWRVKSWRARLARPLFEILLRRIARRFRPFYSLVPIEPFVASPQGDVDPREDTRWLPDLTEEEGRWLADGAKLLADLQAPPTLPTTYVYGTAWPTPCRAWIPARSVEGWRGRADWDGPGDGAVPSHAARSADLAAGTTVCWIPAGHPELPGRLEVAEIVLRAARGGGERREGARGGGPAPLPEGAGGERRDGARGGGLDLDPEGASGPALLQPHAAPLTDPIAWARAHVAANRARARAAPRWDDRPAVRLPRSALTPPADVRAVAAGLQPGARALVHGDLDSARSVDEVAWAVAQRWEDVDDLLPLRLTLGREGTALGEAGVLEALRRGVEGPGLPPGGAGALSLSDWIREHPVLLLAVVRSAAEADFLFSLPLFVGSPTALALFDPGRAATASEGATERWSVTTSTRRVWLFVSATRDTGERDGLSVRVGVDAREEGALQADNGTRLLARDLAWPVDPVRGGLGEVPVKVVVRAVGYTVERPVRALVARPGQQDWEEIEIRPAPAPVQEQRAWVEVYADRERLGELAVPVYRRHMAHLHAEARARLAAVLDHPEDLARLDELNAPGSPRTELERWLESLAGRHADGATRQAALDALAELAEQVIAPDRRAEATVGANDLLPVRFLQEALDAARAVGRLVVVDRSAEGSAEGGEPRKGTAWLLTPTLVMTCRHVVAPEHLPEATLVDLNAGRSTLTFELEGTNGAVRQTLTVQRLRFVSRHLDAAVLELSGPADAPPLRWTPAPPAFHASVKTHLNILQHPGGRNLAVALRDNVLRAATPARLVYTADTEPGSSGAPVMTDRMVAVALHQRSGTGELTVPGGAGYNSGVPLAAVFAELRHDDPALWAEIAPHEWHDP